jgi:GTP-binding protein Era
MDTPPLHRCGTVAIIGRPNVGKSTLLNHFLRQKIAIVSPKPETTRERLLGILTLPTAQILFLDTPGILPGPKTLLGRFQVKAAREALGTTDLLLLLVEATAGVMEEDRQIIRSVGVGVPVFLAINKVDRVEKKFLLPQIEEYHRLHPFREIFPISALRGENVEGLLSCLIGSLPEGPPLYPSDQVTDRSVRAMAQELIREKALLFTHEEVPHAVAVTIDEWRPGVEKGQSPMTGPKEQGPSISHPSPLHRDCTYIRATLYVERDSQKGILIGKEGGLMKRIGKAARQEIEPLVEGAVFLDLWVKVARNWRKDPQMLKRFGYGG